MWCQSQQRRNGTRTAALPQMESRTCAIIISGARPPRNRQRSGAECVTIIIPPARFTIRISLPVAHVLSPYLYPLRHRRILSVRKVSAELERFDTAANVYNKRPFLIFQNDNNNSSYEFFPPPPPPHWLTDSTGPLNSPLFKRRNLKKKNVTRNGSLLRRRTTQPDWRTSKNDIFAHTHTHTHARHIDPFENRANTYLKYVKTFAACTRTEFDKRRAREPTRTVSNYDLALNIVTIKRIFLYIINKRLVMKNDFSV